MDKNAETREGIREEEAGLILETLQPGDIQRLYQDHQKLLVLYGFAHAISLILDPEVLLHETMNVLFGLVKAERGAVFLFDEKTERLTPWVVRSRDKKDPGKEIVLSNTILHMVLKERKGVFTLDAKADSRFSGSQSIQMESIRSCLCVPLESQTRLLGGLYVDSRLKEGGLSKEDLALVSSLANQTAIALENVELVQRLGQERRRIEGILNGLTVGVVSIEEKGDVSFLNPKARQLLCCDGQSLSGMTTTSLFGNDTLKPLYEWMERFQHKPTPVNSEEIVLSMNGVRQVWEASLIPLHQLQEKRWILLLEDVTEKQELAREVSRTEKLRSIGEMTAGLIHEINNPMNIISGRIQLLQMNYREDPEIQKAAQIIRQQVERATRITEKLLNFAKQRPPELKPLDFCLLVKEVMENLETQFVSGRVTLACHLPKEPCVIQADAAQLEEVVVNLAVNALQAMPGGGTLTVRCLREGAGVHLTVQDTGVGIPPEHLQKIFVPFFTTKPHGTGLGLSVVHGIVEAHHGALRVESAAGRGTTFFLTFPYRREGESA